MKQRIIITTLLLLIGLGGALLAKSVGTPMPFMLGALTASGLLAGFFGRYYPKDYEFPPLIKQFFIGIIGVMIGGQVSPQIFAHAGGLAFSLAAIAIFVIAAQLMNFTLFHRIGGYDKPTSWFAASPGGLVEAISMGEDAGADIRVLTILQFLRIILVVSVLPIGLSFWHGTPVGSAAGVGFANGNGGLGHIPLVVIIVVAGGMFGRLIRLPAGRLTGPLILAALLSLFGWADVSMPTWLLSLAQIVLGVHLGIRFHGVNPALLARAFRMSVLSVGGMLVLGFGLAFGVSWITAINLEVLFISYAPGGVAEMGLIAISLSANPSLVALHHLSRITLTIFFLSMARRFKVIPSTKQG